MVGCHVFLSNISLVIVLLAFFIGSEFRELGLPRFFLLDLYGSLNSPVPHIGDLIISECIIIVEVFWDEWARLKHEIESLISRLPLDGSTGGSPFSPFLVAIDGSGLWVGGLSYSDTPLHAGRSHGGAGSWCDLDASLRGHTQWLRHLFHDLVHFGVSLAVVNHWALGLGTWFFHAKETVVEPRVRLENACYRILQT